MATTELCLLCGWRFRHAIAQGHSKPVSNVINLIFMLYIYIFSQERVHVYMIFISDA